MGGDETVPIIMIIMRDNVHTKCMNALQQVTARKGRPIIVCEKGDLETQKWADDDRYIEVPKTVDALQSILTVIPMPLLWNNFYFLHNSLFFNIKLIANNCTGSYP